MQAQEFGEAIGLDITSELIVSRHNYNPDDLMAARSCPECGRQPARLSSRNFLAGARLEVAMEKPFPDLIELECSGMLSCECGHCGLIYCIFIFGPLDCGEMALTGYFTIVENRFLKKVADELEALEREGRLPENVDDWEADRLAAALARVFSLMDDLEWPVVGHWKEGEYRKKWAL